MPILTRFESNVLHLIQYHTVHDTEYHTHLKKYYTCYLYFKSVSISNGNDNKVISPNKKQECGKILTATITRNGLNSLHIYFQFKTGSLFVDSRYVIIQSSHMFVHIHMILLIRTPITNTPLNSLSKV